MRLYRLDSNEQSMSNFLAAQPLSQELKHIALSRREILKRAKEIPTTLGVGGPTGCLVLNPIAIGWKIRCFAISGYFSHGTFQRTMGRSK